MIKVLPRNSFLFLSDAYYPGWQAFANEEETKIYGANYAFRAVYLPKGKHQVRFVYTMKKKERLVYVA